MVDLGLLDGPSVRYGDFGEAWDRHSDTVRLLIERHVLKRVCEVGGGANPALPLSYVQERGLTYAILDISAAELEKAPTGYRKIVMDICSADAPVEDAFDLVFTKMLAEHVADAELFHRNVYKLLAPGGLAFHFFPTLYSPPFVANYLFPESLSRLLLDAFSPRDRVRHAKFPAYYRWCRGPTRRQLDRFGRLGYEVVQYGGFFGHAYYQRLSVAHQVSRRIARFLVSHPVPQLTSFAYLVLRRPG
jgi:SAM-dependent methyltransferase